MNDDNIADLPDWDAGRFSNEDNEDNEGEEWKPQPTLEACKVLYAKWREIVFLLKGALSNFTEAGDDTMLSSVAGTILGDAFMVGAKIRSSEAAGIYIVRMENASIIRKYAQAIASELLLFIEEDDIDHSYIEVIRDEIDKFRLLFIGWVNTFEKDDIADDWGLY